MISNLLQLRPAARTKQGKGAAVGAVVARDVAALAEVAKQAKNIKVVLASPAKGTRAAAVGAQKRGRVLRENQPVAPAKEAEDDGDGSGSGSGSE